MSDEESIVGLSKVDMEYYRVVRTTLHGLDNVRINAAIGGLTISSAFLGAAFSANEYLKAIPVFGFEFYIHNVLSYLSCLFALMTSVQFFFKISMFSYFIARSADIANKIESNMKISDDMKLTMEFDKHPYAGPKGDELFKISIKMLALFSITGIIVSLILIFSKSIITGVFLVAFTYFMDLKLDKNLPEVFPLLNRLKNNLNI